MKGSHSMSDNPLKEYLNSGFGLELLKALSHEERIVIRDKFKDFVAGHANSALPFVKKVIGLKGIDNVEVVFSKSWKASGGFNASENKIVLNCAKISGPEEMLAVLSHECIHAHQFERGDLRGDVGQVVWCGKEFGDVGDERDTPWEVEAYDNMFKVAKKAEDLMKAHLNKNSW